MSNTISFLRTSTLVYIFAFVALLFSAITFSVPDPVEASGIVYYVDKTSGGGDGLSWGNAFTDVQSALDLATFGDQIWVAKGVYTPSVRLDLANARTATFSLTEGVEMYGGFSGGEDFIYERDFNTNLTVLSGDIDSNDTTDADGILLNHSGAQGNNAYHVVFAWQISSATTRLDGFVVTGGDANGPYDYINDFYDGVDIDCNYDCGGGIRNYGSNVTYSNLVVQGNYADLGGGIYNNGSTSYFANILLQGNRGKNNGAAVKNTASDVLLTNIVMVGNSMSLWGGAGISNHDSHPEIRNSIIAFNEGNFAAGGIVNESNSNPTMVNSIMWGNVAQQNNPPDEIENKWGSLTVSYSLITGSTPYAGTGNITSTVSPFVQDASAGADGTWGTADDDYGDLTLVSNAVVIDAGDNSSLPVDSADLDYDGNVAETIPFDLLRNGRISSGTVDMGAYEYQVVVLVTPTLSVSASDVSTTTLSWDEAYGCAIDVYHSGSPYTGYALVESDASSPYDMSYSGEAFYYLEATCAGETAVSDKIGRFQFDLESGS